MLLRRGLLRRQEPRELGSTDLALAFQRAPAVVQSLLVSVLHPALGLALDAIGFLYSLMLGHNRLLPLDICSPQSAAPLLYSKACASLRPVVRQPTVSARNASSRALNCFG